MSERIDQQRLPPEDALAQRVEARQGAGSAWARALRELGAVDRAVYRAVADTPTPQLDAPFAGSPTLRITPASGSASPPPSPCSAAHAGAAPRWRAWLAIGVTSAAVNLGIKPIARRRRPDPGSGTSHGTRKVSMPESTSFPSGHSASAFAFAYAVGRHLPVLAVPIRLLAGGVAYSRVHTGVHYPGDVAIGSIVGAGTAAIVAAAADGISRSRRREGT